MSNRTSAFRALHQRVGAFVLPNPWDVGSARILAALGAEALATTSAGMAFSQGVPEGAPSRAAVLAHCRELVESTPLPVSADLEKGFGDSPEDVAETIRAAAETGLAGCSIEDHTGDRAAPIFEHSLAVERISAACAARDALPGDFVLTARCESLLWGGRDLDAVIRRLQDFEAVGADALYAPGLYDIAAIRQLCAELGRPVNVVMGMPGATFTRAELEQAGVKRISLGSAFARVAYGAFVKAAREALGAGDFTRTQDAIGFDEMESFFADFV